MALKKKKSKKKQSPQEKIRNLIRNPATWLVAFVLLFATYHYGSIWIEKRQFEKLDKQAYQYIQSIAKKFPGEITREQYCGYSSAKFSKGSLGCTVTSKIKLNITDRQEISRLVYYAEKKTTGLNWGSVRETAQETTPGSEQEDVNLYFSNSDICWVSVYENRNSKFIRAYCSGNARAEHYTVRDS